MFIFPYYIACTKVAGKVAHIVVHGSYEEAREAAKADHKLVVIGTTAAPDAEACLPLFAAAYEQRREDIGEAIATAGFVGQTVATNDIPLSKTVLDYLVGMTRAETLVFKKLINVGRRISPAGVLSAYRQWTSSGKGLTPAELSDAWACFEANKPPSAYKLHFFIDLLAETAAQSRFKGECSGS